ncbi:MAG: hypothetical protein HZC36_02420 [Armatimonadetes bacterium]|nr:hypothetical protein [Armatimonadota bacterium]
MTYDDLVSLAMELPETSEGPTWGTSGVKRKNRFMFRIKEDGESVAIRLDWDTRDRLLKERPEVCFLTPHYENYPALLALLESLDSELACELVRASWEFAPSKDQRS